LAATVSEVSRLRAERRKLMEASNELTANARHEAEARMNNSRGFTPVVDTHSTSSSSASHRKDFGASLTGTSTAPSPIPRSSAPQRSLPSSTAASSRQPHSRPSDGFGYSYSDTDVVAGGNVCGSSSSSSYHYGGDAFAVAGPAYDIQVRGTTAPTTSSFSSAAAVTPSATLSSRTPVGTGAGAGTAVASVHTNSSRATLSQIKARQRLALSRNSSSNSNSYSDGRVRPVNYASHTDRLKELED
jgi:hypothetical protein